MKLVLTGIASLLLVLVCHGQINEQVIETHKGIHKVQVVEILHTTAYTYLNVKENDSLQWLAMPKTEAELGGIYYYMGGNEMKDFKSSELNRTFESVMFLGGVVKEQSELKSGAVEIQKDSTVFENRIEPVANGITIAELFANKEKYAGKIVRVKGKVTKYNLSIKGKNWVHIQDGTSYEDNYDLVANSVMESKRGEILIVEGKVTLDKELGFGYTYKILLEDCKFIRE